MNKQIEHLEEFIKLNDLKFTEGRRNTDCTILIGYALYYTYDVKEGKFKSEDTKLVLESILEHKLKIDLELKKEFEKVFEFAKRNKYGKWWEKEDNRSKYKLLK
jgi:hypothetical protein